MDIKSMVEGLVFIDSLPSQSQSDLLDNIIELTSSRLLRMLPKEVVTVPDELAYIVVEVAVKRYNRIGSEGMKHEAVDGHSMTFGGDDFSEYESEIASFIDDMKKVSAKVVRFL